MDDAINDVKPADETTAPAPSGVDETTAPVESTSDETSDDLNKTIPYSRFSEVNEKYRQTEQTLSQTQQEIQELRTQLSSLTQANVAPQDPQVVEAKESLKQLLKEVAPELGYVSRDELRRSEVDKEVKAELAGLEKKYDGSNGLPKFDRKSVIDFVVNHRKETGKTIDDPEVAYKMMHENAIIDWKVKQAISKSQGLRTEGSNGTGSSNVGTTNDDLRAAIAKGDTQAYDTFLSRLAKQHTKS